MPDHYLHYSINLLITGPPFTFLICSQVFATFEFCSSALTLEKYSNGRRQRTSGVWEIAVRINNLSLTKHSFSTCHRMSCSTLCCSYSCASQIRFPWAARTARPRPGLWLLRPRRVHRRGTRHRTQTISCILRTHLGPCLITRNRSDTALLSLSSTTETT